MSHKSEASRGTGAQSETVKPTGCGFDPTRGDTIYLNLYFHFFALVSRTSTALSFATQHAMPSEFGRKWRTECLNTYAGYSVKLIYLFIYKSGDFLLKEQSCPALTTVK